MSIKLTLTTPEGVRLTSEVEFVQVPAAAGDIGVLPGHSPLLSPVNMGTIIARTGEKLTHFAISGGFIEIHPESVLILAESAEDATDIDTARATKAKERATDRLEDPGPAIDIPRAKLALARAENRLRTVEEA